MLVSFVIGGNPRVVHIFGLAALIPEGFSSSQAKSSSWAACSKDHWIPKWVVMEYDNRVWCCYNAVNFLKNIMGIGCLLWIQHLIDILPEFPNSYITLERPWGGCPPGIQVAADRAPRSGWVTPERPPAVLPWFNDLANGQWKNFFFQTDANHKTNIRTEFFNSKQINRVVERPNSTESKLNYRFYV